MLAVTWARIVRGEKAGDLPFELPKNTNWCWRSISAPRNYLASQLLNWMQLLAADEVIE